MRLIPCLAVLSLTAGAAQAFDQQVISALSQCHGYLWEVPEFAGLPNAAISVWPASATETDVKVYWVVDWTDPAIKAAGQCEVSGGEVIGYENYIEQSASE